MTASHHPIVEVVFASLRKTAAGFVLSPEGAEKLAAQLRAVLATAESKLAVQSLAQLAYLLHREKSAAAARAVMSVVEEQLARRGKSERSVFG